MKATLAILAWGLVGCVVEPLRAPEPVCVCAAPPVLACPVPEPTPPPRPPPKREIVTSVDGTVVEVRYPTEPARGHILVLPGWGFDRREVCWRSSFCDDARAAGFVVILVGMDKSVYAGEVYPQTRSDMAVQKTRTWVVERLIPELQARLGVLGPESDNFLYGMSTGGRGVALLALHAPGLFKAGAALSGDFDMMLETKDPLLLLHYGSHRRFPERWTGEDNPAAFAARIQVPLYIASGTADRIVPVQQSIEFHKKMVAAHPELLMKLELVEGAGHDFDFWGTQTEAVLAFFQAVQARPASDVLPGSEERTPPLGAERPPGSGASPPIDKL